MYCKRCGKELNENARFCPYCGTNQVSETEREEPYPFETEPPQKPQKPPKPVKTIVISIAAVIGALFIAGAGVGIKIGLDSKNWKDIGEAVTAYGIPYFTDEKEQLEKIWEDTGIFARSDRKELLNEMKELEQSAGEADEWFAEETGSLEEAIAEKENYKLSEEYADYEAYLEECKAALEKKDYKLAKELADNKEERLSVLVEQNKIYIEEKMKLYHSLDMSAADISDKTNFETYLQEAENLASEEKYSDLAAVFEPLDEIAGWYIEPENKLNINIQQIDVLDYPHVKLYAQVEDMVSGEVPSLDNTMFFIRKQDANANYVKQKISKVSQLNEMEALNVAMVADVSGSMIGEPLNEAKSVMSNFVSSVQFPAGDKVELISFSTGVYIEEEFTDSKASLTSRIHGLETSDMTSLYDALYTAVTRVAAQPGAKCVIAFTDGQDNYSSCSSQDVIDIAKRYHVPIFIIGIGTGGYSEIQPIAAQTGGAYYETNEIISMSDIYNEIYKQEKELYLVEFEDTTGNINSSANIMMGYHSEIYGGTCNYSYTPNVLLSVEGSSLYQDGPEAVVEGYMRAFDDAMTNSDFSAISGYLKPGSSIYKEQEKYVMRNISELLEAYEIEAVDYESGDACVVTTRETYYVQKEDEPLELMTQQCKYRVVKENDVWKMTEFADSVKVLSRVNQ